ncbi:hypothetical protein GCM10022284_25180 [Streptomyces hundungensis]
MCPIFTLALSLTSGGYPPNNIGKRAVVIVDGVNTRQGWHRLIHSRRNGRDMNEALEVWIDQDLCTGDGICVQYAPEVFELDIDGLAYVKSADDELLQTPRATTPVPLPLLQDVVDSAKECPGDCIHVRRVSDSVEVYGPDAE